LLRVRQTEDFEYARPGLLDEILINANLLEFRPDSAVAAVSTASVPYSIDPLLTQFQLPGWWMNADGTLKGNHYLRLARAYFADTGIDLPTTPLVSAVGGRDETWVRIAANVVRYQRDRLLDIRPQLDFFGAELRPVRIFAPALVAFGPNEDRINRLLGSAASAAAGRPISLPVIVPVDRLRDPVDVAAVLEGVPTEGVAEYFLWTPWVTEDLLLADEDLFANVLTLIDALANRDIQVGHLYGTYLTLALRDVGITTFAHHLGWIDKGQPAEVTEGGARSCQLYVPGIRRPARFLRARQMGRHLGNADYQDLFCNCTWCVGLFDAGHHPLDLMLEEQTIPWGKGSRQTPTSRATAANTWHFLQARRQEVLAFSMSSSSEVIANDIDRAARLAGSDDRDRLTRIASTLA